MMIGPDTDRRLWTIIMLKLGDDWFQADNRLAEHRPGDSCLPE
jgi:hypothetical protein